MGATNEECEDYFAERLPKAGQRFIIVAKTDAAGGRLLGTIEENVFTRLFIVADDIRFAARAFHFRSAQRNSGIAEKRL